MSLKESIATLMNQLDAQIPEATRVVMQDEIERLAQSGIVERSLKVGDQAPEFVLPDAAGNSVSSVRLLERGPLVVSFYRGGW
ncbi:MAG TPA: hypothetical protein PLG17_02350 [Thermodesulfobacteriota bacterium]|nr:hypothetical protein [Thermodesulfobacteriota bacterium]HNU70342.1 hypothetical protein [Thermodesulfobacteriota bacterium]HOC38912.1 hypothetical protein [Thermodesulfobacteriota bacterium]HQO77334.1 hypothetical protein [Thermodesulfobacteriota bacterium]